MTDAELADKLELHNRWRRGEMDEMPLKPKELGEVIDEVVRRLRQRSGKMTPPEFVQLVRDMRQAQKEYFRYRTQDALRRSKELEQKVDDWLFVAQTPELPFTKEGR